MEYFVREKINGDPNAGSKARNDISYILRKEGWTPITLDYEFDERGTRKKAGFLQKVMDNLKLRIEWQKKLKKVRNGDVVLVQIPVLRRPAALSLAFRGVKRRGGKIIFLVHDLEILRYAQREDINKWKRLRIEYEEKSVIRCADKIIVHNIEMKKVLARKGIQTSKLIPLGIFDYIVSENEFRPESRTNEKNVVAIAGTLRPHKSKYLMHLPSDVIFHLYGVGYEDQGRQNIEYFGAFPPEELPCKIEAAYGLVWDGDTTQTCSGVYGEYLKINNPHKTSLYLAAGMPVIIWEDAALAEFVRRERCGIVVPSISKLNACLAEIGEDEYNNMMQNAIRLSARLQSGYYTKRAIKKILKEF